MKLEGLGSCAGLTTEHADDAARSATSMRQLLAWAATIARPGRGGPKILMAVARLSRASWVVGTPYVEIHGDEATTSLSILVDTATTVREPLVPTTRLAVPVEEFTRAVRLAPQLIAPFRSSVRDDLLLLSLPTERAASSSTTESQSDSFVQANPHTHPTVRRMVVVRPEALRHNDDE